MAKQLSYCTPDKIAQDFQHAIIVGYAENLKPAVQKFSFSDKTFKLCQELRKTMAPAKSAETRSFYEADNAAKLKKITLIMLPEPMSRNMAPANYSSLDEALSDELVSEEKISLLIAVKDPAHVMGFAAQLAKHFPAFTQKTAPEDKNTLIQCAFLSQKELTQNDYQQIDVLVQSIQLCAKLVDTPTNMLNTKEFSAILEAQAKELSLQCKKIKGHELEKQGFGGIYNVGKAAESEPVLCILSYIPEQPTHTVALVGKGITYDTGGLSLKPREHMVNMKSDMAGAAAVLGALRTAALMKLPCAIHGIFCLAENAIGPKSLRPDDIIKLYSGKTIEINNTDAEGRLLLADGVAYASKELQPRLIVDIATLTGAQLICTGQVHAAILTANEKLEKLVMNIGKTTGELVYPILYAPELLMKEFSSKVADYKNSCKNRLNAQSSCAGHFVEASLDKDYKGDWLHIDIAGPAWDNDRSLAYGVALLYVLLVAYK